MSAREPWKVEAKCSGCDTVVSARVMLPPRADRQTIEGWQRIIVARHRRADTTCPMHHANLPPTREEAYSDHVRSVLTGAKQRRGPITPAVVYEPQAML